MGYVTEGGAGRIGRRGGRYLQMAFKLIQIKAAIGFYAGLALWQEGRLTDRMSVDIPIVMPWVTSLILWLCAYALYDEALWSRIVAWLWLLGSCCFANVALAYSGFAPLAKVPVELGIIIPIILAAIGVAGLYSYHGPSILRGPATALLGVIVLAFCWVESAGRLPDIVGGAVVYGGSISLAIMSVVGLPRREELHAGICQ